MPLSNSELWKRVKRLERKTLYTCTRQGPNKILRVTDNRVQIEGKTPVFRTSILDIYGILIRTGRLTSRTIRKRRCNNGNSPKSNARRDKRSPRNEGLSATMIR